MSGVTLVLKHKQDVLDCIAFEQPEKIYKEKIEQIFKRCEKNGGFVTLTIEQPYKPRTTGDKSQNNLFWKLATIIAQETGCTLEEVEEGLKDRAISKGYPYHINRVTGKPTGDSMKTINTVQCSYLIDTAYEVIAEFGIVLPPEFAQKTALYNEDKTGEDLVMKAKSVSQLASESLGDFATEKMNPDDMEIFY